MEPNNNPEQQNIPTNQPSIQPMEQPPMPPAPQAPLQPTNTPIQQANVAGAPQPNFNSQYTNIPTAQANDPGKVLAIVSLVLALFLALVGLILAIIANNKSKKAGFNNVIAKVSVAVNSFILVVGLIIIIGLMVMIIPGIKARAVANDFSSAIRAGNYDRAVEAATVESSNSESAKQFFATLKKSIGTSQTEVSSGTKDGKWAFVYTIEGGSSKYYRVVVESGKVSNAVVSNERMGLFVTAETVTAPTNEQVAATNASCEPLVNTDFTPILPSAGTIQGMDEYTDNFFFQPDSTVYTYPSSVTSHTAGFVAFNKATKKPYKIEISGSVYKDYNTSAGKAMAAQRAEKVKNDLIAAGIPASLITVVAPKEYAYGQTNMYDPSIFRNVDIKISTACQ